MVYGAVMFPPKSSKILIAMSGGVDSAVTASIFQEKGYDCIGVTMRLVPEHQGKSPFEPCCGLEATEDARRVCEKLGIPHEVLHAIDRFDRDIIDNFLDEYADGRTPNPCVRCNRMIKFGALYQRADELGADYIAMGHYARLEERGARISLRRASYRPKDQSYVLAPLMQSQLRRALFPLGGMTKEAVREHAWGLDFGMATKGESQEICFVPDRNYGNYIEGRRGVSVPGPIVNMAGEVLGEHKGLIHHTPGQRRGLGISAERPYYVLRLRAADNAVVVGHQEETLCRSFTTGPIAWGGLASQGEPFSCQVQIRSRHGGVAARVVPRGHGDGMLEKQGAEVIFEEPASAVTPGQWAVFYDGDDFVLGSAIIQEFALVGEGAASV
jgi:tRNA-specific 2-thiouridylase